jgi:hypothetical protein
MTQHLTHKELLERLSYDPEIGVFTWLKSNSNKARNGSEAGYVTSQGYRSININNKNYLAHRLAWFYVNGCFPEKGLDHINRNRTDNRISNLRVSTHRENNMNREGKGCTYWERDNKWKAQIQVDKVNKHLGYFDTEEEARAVYFEAKKKYHTTWSPNV